MVEMNTQFLCAIGNNFGKERLFAGNVLRTVMNKVPLGQFEFPYDKVQLPLTISSPRPFSSHWDTHLYPTQRLMNKNHLLNPPLKPFDGTEEAYYKHLLYSRRIGTVMSNSAIATKNREITPPAEGDNYEISLAAHYIKETWGNQYGGWDDKAWKNLHWEKIARIAVPIVKSYEENKSYLSHPIWFESALQDFHREMKNQDGWSALPDKDKYYEQEMISADKEQCYLPAWENSVFTLHAVQACHELFRDPYISDLELGVV